jgi:ribosomal 30S subunit maturation factor RimM
MKLSKSYALTVAVGALMCGAAGAQERANPAPSARPVNPIERVATRHLSPGDKRASELIGATVKNTSGDDIGEVEDLIVSGKNDIVAAVIGIGGVLGIGEKRIGVAYGDLEVSPDGHTAYLDMTKAQIDAAPAFDYDVEKDAAVSSTRPTTPARTATTPDTTRRETQVARSEPNPARPAADAAAPARPAADRTAADAERTLKSGEQNAKALIGADVVDANDAKVGKIRDLIVAPSGVQAVMMVGGTGIVNGHLVVVPFSSLKIQAAQEAGREPERVQTSMTASQLEALPEFRYN